MVEWLDGWLVVLFIFCFVRLRQKWHVEKFKFNVIADITHTQTKTPNWSFSSFGRRLSKSWCLNLRKPNKYTCITLFTSKTTIRRIFFPFWWHVIAVIGSFNRREKLFWSNSELHADFVLHHHINANYMAAWFDLSALLWTHFWFNVIRLPTHWPPETCSLTCCIKRFVLHFLHPTCLISKYSNRAKFNLPALATADAESDPLSRTSSFFVVADAKLVCDVRLSDRLNVSRKFRSDDNDVDFFGELFVGLTTSSSLSARTYKLPIFSLIFVSSSESRFAHCCCFWFFLLKSTLKWHQRNGLQMEWGWWQTLR